MKKNVYMYNNHFAVQQKLTQHCKSTIFQQNKFKKFNFLYLLHNGIEF